MSVKKIYISQKVKDKITCLIILTSWSWLKVNKYNFNEDDVLVDLVHRVAPLAQQDPEHPKDKA